MKTLFFLTNTFNLILTLFLFSNNHFSIAEAAEKLRPNIVIIAVDDMGFSDIGCYGGEIQTPNLDRLAENGLKFTQFYNTARCWSTRSALMSGYYPQQIGMDPYKKGDKLPVWSSLLPHHLKPIGYRSYHSGKWHVNGAPKVVAEGGFDHSYLLEDHNHHFNPQNHFADDKPLQGVEPNSGYYTTCAITDYTLQHLDEHAKLYSKQPFFVYTAYTVPHFPLQALPEDIAKYKERYLIGWDAIRTERFAKQKSLGIVNVNELSAREDTVGAPYRNKNLIEQLGNGEFLFPADWNLLNEEQKHFQAAKMAIHAAMVDRVDQEVGRILDKIREIGAWDDTIIFFLSDNGASAEIMIRGDGHHQDAALGSAETFLCLGPGWSTASNTPYRRHKVWNHEGGISTPLIVHWQKGIKQPNTLRHELGHVVDIVPTILDLLDIDPSQTLVEYGVSTSESKITAPPFPGVSLLPAILYDKKSENGKTNEAKEVVKRDYIYFEHEGNAALRIGDWKCLYTKTGEAQGTPPAERSVGTEGWSLYNFHNGDRIEQHDLAKNEPKRLIEMITKWRDLNQSFRKQSLEK